MKLWDTSSRFRRHWCPALGDGPMIFRLSAFLLLRMIG